MAQSSSWVRLWQPVLASSREMWLSTVRGLSSSSLAMARLLGERWQNLTIVGVEPAQVRTGIGLTPEVTAGACNALATARQLLEEMRAICV